MRIRTLLNDCQKFKSFVHQKEYTETINGKLALVIEIAERKNSRPICSCCEQTGSQYDRVSQTRDDQYIPLWGCQVYFRYRRRRVNCKNCGVKVEQVPWAKGKQKLTDEFKLHLARWARRLSWKETSEAFQTSWDHVYQSVKFIVAFGLANRNLDNINAIGVDEVQYGKGHQCITLVYQLDNNNKRLLYVGKKPQNKNVITLFLSA